MDDRKPFLGEPEYEDRSARPAFVGEHWCDYLQGLSFTQAIADGFERSAAGGSGGPAEGPVSGSWRTLINAFEGLKRGDFSCTNIVLDLAFASEDEDLRSCALRLSGHAGDSSGRQRIPAFFASRFALETRED
jgi:hypothetical protein